jgi:hypothetical protein
MQDGKQNDKIIIYAHLYSLEVDHGTHPNG